MDEKRYQTTRGGELIPSSGDPTAHADTVRNELIDAYFDAMDAEDLGILRPALADDFVYESLSGDFVGFSGLETYMEDLRGLSNTGHDVTLRVHGDDASVTEGTVTGENKDGPVEADFCDVFDDEEAAITRIGVYLNDA